MSKSFSSVIGLGLLAGLLNLVGCASQPEAAQDSLIENLQTANNLQIVRRGDEVKVIVYVDRCFDLDTADLEPTCKPELSTVAALIRNYGRVTVRVAGYTDDATGGSQAVALSRHRADSVMTYLWSRGVPPTYFVSEGYGAKNFIATNGNARGSALNRRIEISWRAGVYGESGRCTYGC